MNIGILTCSALTYYVNAAQKKMKTNYPVIEIDRNYHDRPKVLRTLLEEALAKFPEDVDTILVAMGACGNCWEGMVIDKKVVIPRMDDCVTILLHKNDEWHPNLKKPGHFYQIDEENEHFLLTTIYKKAVEKYGERRAKRICNIMFESYTNVDVVDTGVFDCHTEDFVTKMQREADFIHVPLGYVEGSNIVIEKLVSGNWDDQFVVVEAGTIIEGRMFLEI
jgi:hypothetical protein